MSQSSPKTGKILTSLLLTLFIFTAFVISGFTVASFDDQTDYKLPPNQGPVSFRLTNVIKNGDFEKNPRSSIATYWEPYNNGQAQYGWYAEKWVEAVHSGKFSQLLEIAYVEGVPDRVIAIYQTVDVVPNASYTLTIHALMRSSAPDPLRNQDDYAMHWGVDYRGKGTYLNVKDWVTMPLSEQLRIGSNGPANDNRHLFYERITGTIFTTDTNRITLFIRGVKINPTGTEINFNVDDVSLIGPDPASRVSQSQTDAAPAATPAAAPDTEESVAPANADSAAPVDEDTTAPTSEEPAGNQDSLPNAGAILPKSISTGALILGGLVLVVLGASAAISLLQNPK